MGKNELRQCLHSYKNKIRQKRLVLLFLGGGELFWWLELGGGIKLIRLVYIHTNIIKKKGIFGLHIFYKI